MTAPGFTAEATLYQSRGHHRAGVRSTRADGKSTQVAHATVRPQLMIERSLRVTGPYGPIGLPGQDCYGACWHICMSFGSGLGGLSQCVAGCTSQCSNNATMR